MFWQLSQGHGRVLSFQFQTSNGDLSSILISGTLTALMVTESRFYKPLGISSNYRLIFPKVIYYTATFPFKQICILFILIGFFYMFFHTFFWLFFSSFLFVFGYLMSSFLFGFLEGLFYGDFIEISLLNIIDFVWLWFDCSSCNNSLEIS